MAVFQNIQEPKVKNSWVVCIPFLNNFTAFVDSEQDAILRTHAVLKTTIESMPGEFTMEEFNRLGVVIAPVKYRGSVCKTSEDKTVMVVSEDIEEQDIYMKMKDKENIVVVQLVKEDFFKEDLTNTTGG